MLEDVSFILIHVVEISGKLGFSHLHGIIIFLNLQSSAAPGNTIVNTVFVEDVFEDT